jgi:His-Xaa-Ser system protein HxsD
VESRPAAGPGIGSRIRGLRVMDGIRQGAVRPFAFVEGRVVALEIESTVYSLPAVLRACYKFADQLYSFVTPADAEAALVVALWSRSGGEVPSGLIGEFCNELADQELRERLARETAHIREMIVTQAFAEGNLTGEDDEGDYEADPLGIATTR